MIPLFFTLSYFNSHAHVERDDMREKRGMTQDISTHTLTWSVTSVYKSLWSAWIISTHTLTWSVTSGAPRRSRSGRFQLTRSRGAWREVDPHLKDKRDFNSHAHVERDIADEYGYEKYSRFQLTRSRGAWRAENGNDYFAVIISTHTLTWSVTCKEKGFTIWICHFNSHAHVERDASLGEFEADQNISTHTLTWSVTTQERQEKEQERHFNSHAHVERDRYDVLLWRKH